MLTIPLTIPQMFFLLMAAHALCDFTFQAGPMSVEKNRHSRSDLQKSVPWYYWLSAHTFIHGGAIYLITKSLSLAILETVLHWFIDFAKCEGWTNIHADQFLHFICRVAYCAMFWAGISAGWDNSLLAWGHFLEK